MDPKRYSVVTVLLAVVLAAGFLAAPAAACPDAKPGATCRPASGSDEVATASATSHTMPTEATPSPDLDTPALSGFVPNLKGREPEIRPLENPLGWLLSGSGPKGGQKLSAERSGHSTEKKPTTPSVAKKAAKADSNGSWRWSGFGNHIAKPHRMPGVEIL